ncbi:helicase-like transcription factor [Stegastes partitus]|uniref:Helicase-like transcription factor n=1 Tax=Stegastes partitus TaxID=144197 RepID=A0A9Y4JRK5_9TELE|nr:PREDICTED: helicase-like transcription factor [Stegastes partitus]
MFSRRWRFGWDRYTEVDLFADRHETNAETLSQAIRAAAASEEPDADGSVLFGHLRGSVVGLRYYTGVVNRGEMVGLVREPQNPYDRNAVMVANVYGNQVGHIKKELAAAMAYVMDNNLAKVEGVVHSGTNNSFNMPVNLSFWGKEENKNTVMESLARRGFKLNTGVGVQTGASQKSFSAPGTYGFPPKKGLTIPLTADELKNAFDNLFEGLMESKDGEKEAAEYDLSSHNFKATCPTSQGQEKAHLPELLFSTLTTKMGITQLLFTLPASLSAFQGKTLTTISLILTNFHKGKPLPVEKSEKQFSPTKAKAKPQMASKLQGSSKAGMDDTAGGSQCSERTQVEVTSADTPDVVDVADDPGKSTSKGKKKPTKRKPSKEASVLFEDLDFAAALTGSTSDTGSKKKKTANVTQRMDSSVTENTDDLSARTTLIICPLSVLSNWLDQFEQHVHPNVKLNVYLYYGSERNRSKQFLSSQDVVITTYNVLSSDFGNKSPLHGISWLRVVLDEGHIIRNPNAQMSKAVLGLKAQRRWILSVSAVGAAATPAELRERLIEKLRLVLASGSDEECSVCLDSVQLPVITHCAHVYCRPCIAQVISTEQDKARCPLCRSEIKTSELVEFPQEELDDENSTNSERWRTSSKVQALMGNLLRVRSEDSSIKCLVVSQFTRFLTILETPLRCTPIQNSVKDLWMLLAFLRLKPFDVREWWNRVIQRPAMQGDRAGMQNLQTLVKCITLRRTKTSEVNGRPLVSLPDKTVYVEQVELSQSEREEYERARKEGKNIIKRCVSSAQAWNPATEEQCIDRCHRLGQKKNVVVTKFIVKDSVEENMVKIQKKKQDLVEKAFGSTNNDRKTSRIDEIQALLEL